VAICERWRFIDKTIFSKFSSDRSVVMSRKKNRRDFMKTTAALGVGFWAAGGVSPRKSRAANEEVRFACIGVGGKGSSDSEDASRNGKVVAICDVDENTLNSAKDKFKGAETFFDYRKMLEKVEKSIDAVTVSTPDHNHACAAAMAMRMGKHCFCQKPLTHSIYEARYLGNLAREKGLTTQMGNQGTADSCLRHSSALIKGGVIGTVKEVHVWTNRPVWPQGGPEPKYEPAPAHVHWAEWIGCAKSRGYSAEIHPFKWRGFWDFGTGALGDMACHTLNMSYMAMGLKFPTAVTAESSGHDKKFYPKWSVITFDFPEADGRPALKMYWYDGGKLPDAKLMAGLPKDGDNAYSSGALLVGEKGNFFSPGDYGGDDRNTGALIDGKYVNHKEIKGVDGKYERSPGHFEEFAEAIAEGKQSVSNFPDYAGPLSETILLGNLAVWNSGEKIEWDAKNLKITGKHADDAELNEIVRHTYHNGYNLEM
jgi:predicted dehydrogenase